MLFFKKWKDIMKGNRYNSGKLRWRNFPLFLMRPLAEVGSSAEKWENNPNGKYETFNFLNGLSVSDNIDSLMRHLDEFIDPNKPDIDPEDGCHVLAKIAWNSLVALYFIKTRPELDDRWKGPGKKRPTKKRSAKKGPVKK
jgi:hypothetical protein